LRKLEEESMTELPDNDNQKYDSGEKQPVARRPWVKPTLECLALNEALSGTVGDVDNFCGSM
jgi:hypothetical protein